MQNQNTTASSAAAATEDEILQSRRTRCEVWTRVMGYHRPVQNFNVGKKAEHYSRQHFAEATAKESKTI
jgi:anaerobic ribonucleoside-triphosphate reductase